MGILTNVDTVPFEMYSRRKAEVLELANEANEITSRDVAGNLGVEIYAAGNLVRRLRKQELLKG